MSKIQSGKKISLQFLNQNKKNIKVNRETLCGKILPLYQLIIENGACVMLQHDISNINLYPFLQFFKIEGEVLKAKPLRNPKDSEALH